MPRKRKSLSASPQRRASLTGSSSVPPFSAGLPQPLPAMSNNRTKVFSNMCEMFPNLDPSLVEMVLNEYKEVETVMDYLLELSTSTKGNTPESTGFTKVVSFLDDFEMESQVPENFHDVCDELAEQPDASYMDGTVCNDLDMLLDEALDKYGLNGPDEYQDTELYHTTDIHHTSCHTDHSSVGDQSKADLQSEDHTCASDSDFGSVEYDTGADLGVAEPDGLLTEVDEPYTLPSSPASDVRLQTASPKSQIKWNPLASSFYPVSNVNPAFIAPVAFNPLQWSSIAGTRPPVAGGYYNPPTFVWNFNHFPQTHRNTEYIKPINTAQSGPQVLKKVTPYVGKVLVLLRGAPGSGKSTLARLILGQNPAGVILSTDDYFRRGGEYQYDITSLGEAHEWNHKRAKDAFEKKISPIIIDNTNLQAWEMKPYVSMAVKYKYKVTFREPDTWWRCKPKELERRNHHGVKKEKIMKMLENFERVSVNSMLNLSHPKASKNANNSQRKIRERTREPSILPQTHKEETSFSLSTDSGNMADIDSADQATQKSIEVSRDGPEVLFDVAKSEIKNLTTAESDNCMDLFQVVQNISDNEVQGNDDSGIKAAADNPGPDIESGTFPINERPELFNFVGDWPVEQTMSQRAPRNKKPRTRQEQPIPCEQESNEATNPDEEQIDKVIEQIDNRSSEENQMKEAAALKMEPNIDFSTVDDNEEHLLGLGKELCISLPVRNKEDCTEEGDSRGACSNKIHNEDCTEEGVSEGACSNKIHNEDCTEEGDSEGACSKKIHNKEDCTEEGDSEGACSNKIHNEDCTEEGDSEGTCSNKIHNEDCTEEGDSEGACSNKMHNEDCTEEGDSEGACSNKIHNEDCTEGGDSEGACSNKIHKEDCTEEGDSKGAFSNKIHNEDCMEEGDSEGVCSSKMSIDQEQVAECSIEGEDIQSTNEDVKIKKPRRNSRNCRLALNFTHKCAISSKHEESECFQQPNVGLCRFTQTEPQDFAVSWRIERRNVDVSDSVKVLKGISSRFTSKSLDGSSAIQENIPYRVAHHKSTFVEEDDIISLGDQDGLDILCKLFQSLSFDILKDLFERCNKDIVWTTNLLLDSGEKIYKDEECETEESDDVESCFYSDKDNNSIMIEEKSILVLEEDCENVETDFTEQCVAEYSPFVNALPLVVAEEMKNGNVLSSNESIFGQQCRIPAELQEVFPNYETITDTMAPDLMWPSDFEADYPNALDSSLDIFQSCNALKPIKKGNTEEIPIDHEDLAINSDMYFPDILVEDNEAQEFLEVTEPAQEQQKTQNKSISGPQAKESLHFNYLELALPPEFAFQLTELFGPVGINPGSLTIEDCVVPVDLKLAESIHKKWKESILERHRQEALSYLLTEYGLSNDPANLGNIVEKSESGVSLGETEPLPFMDHWNIRAKKVSLREIIAEEMALQAHEDSKKSSSSKNCAVKMKEKQLLELFPNIEQQLLLDIFKENNYSLEKTEQFMSSVLEADPVQNVIAQGFQLPVSTVTEKNKEKKLKADNEILSERERYFQDLKFPNYGDFRAEAFLYHQKQQESYRKAAEAHNRGMKQVAAYYAQQGYLYGQKMKEENLRAAVKIFERSNEYLLPENILDLHGLHVDEAMKHLRRVLQDKADEFKQNGGKSHLLVITGRGNHSQGGVPRIKPAVIDFLTNHDYRFQEKTPGVLRVTLK